MPKVVTHISEAYSFDELTDSAKERARDWYRNCLLDSDFDCEIEEFAIICGLIGIDLDDHEVTLYGGGKRREPNIYWSVGYTQSDHASFEGTYDYKADACIKLREINNDDKWEPLRIATALAKIQCENAFGIRAEVKREGQGIEVYDRRNEMRDLGATYDEVRDLMRDIARYLYQQLRDQSDYLYSAEHVDETIEANEYLFDEEGNRHDYA